MLKIYFELIYFEQIFICENLNQYSYNQLLREDLQEFLDNLPLNESKRVVFQQDGTAPYKTRYFNREFGENWIGTYGPIRCHLVLSPLNFFCGVTSKIRCTSQNLNLKKF